MSSQPARVYRQQPLRPTGPPTATVALILCFVVAVAGILGASSVPAWTPGITLLAFTVMGIVMALQPRTRSLNWLLLPVLVAAAAIHIEQTRQAANFATAEHLFNGAVPPFDTVGHVSDSTQQWAVERSEPRLRVARIVARVVDAPPPPVARHQLTNQPRTYLVETEMVAGIGGPPETVHARLRLAVRADPRLPAADALAVEPLYPLPGQRIEATLALTEIDPGSVAPAQYDPQVLWILQGIHGRATLDPRQWRQLPDDAGFHPIWAARHAQIALAGHLNRHLTGRAADTLRALCWGDTSDLTAEDRSAFQHTGTVHLLAISGLHVYIILYLLLLVTRPFLRSRPWRYGALAAGLWVFAALTGFQEPVLRAVLMFSLWIGALAFTRKFDALNAWATAGLLILFFSPQSAHMIGFQLSFVSVGLLCWWTPALAAWLRARVLARLDRWLLPIALDGLAHSLAASSIALAATLPLAVHYFGVAPGWAILANLVLIPLFELLLLLALPLSLLFCVTDPGWPAVALQWLTEQVLHAADGLAVWFGSPPGLPGPTPAALCLSLVVLIACGQWFRVATAPLLALDEQAVRRRFAYPSLSLTLGLGGCVALAISGRWWQPPPGPELLLLGRQRPCVVLQPPLPQQPDSDSAGDHGDGGGWQAWSLYPPGSATDIERAQTTVRQPITQWHALQSPAARAHVHRLAAGVVLLADGPAARVELLAQLQGARLPPRFLLLVGLTAESSRAPDLPPALATALRARLTGVVLLDSPWRLLESDGQAWLAAGAAGGYAVLGADAAPVWRLAPDGRTVELVQNGRARPLALAAR